MKATGLQGRGESMTPIHHREKKGENSHAKRRKRADEGPNTPHSEEEEEEEDEGVSTEMQQDQIRAYRLFILVNTTPRISLKF